MVRASRLRLRVRAWLGVVGFAAACISFNGVSSVRSAQADTCNFTRAWAFIAYDHQVEGYVAARHTSDEDQSTLLQLDGIHDWVGYDADGFNRPPLEAAPIRIDVFLDNGEMRYIYLYDDFYEETDMQWIWVFRSLTVSTDVNGDYLGLHDICASGAWFQSDLVPLLSSDM